MAFLLPLFLLGLGALAVPVLIHLIQREKNQIIAFPSLMFVRRVPYESVRRRRIRHWLLLAMRLGALALIVAAFARPFVRGSVAAIGGGAREVIVLLDRSYSMGYGDRWTRAQAAARQAIDGLGASDRASLVLFGTGSEVVLQSIDDRARLLAAIAAATPGAEATRYGPALKVAGTIAAESTRPRREVVLITDFQKNGWAPTDDQRLPAGTTFSPVSVGDLDTVNLAVAPVALRRGRFEGQERVTVTGGVTNRGTAPVSRRRARPGNRRPRGRDRARGGGAAGVGVPRLRAGHGDARRAARRRPCRRRRAGRRQRFPLRVARNAPGAGAARRAGRARCRRHLPAARSGHRRVAALRCHRHGPRCGHRRRAGQGPRRRRERRAAGRRGDRAAHHLCRTRRRRARGRRQPGVVAAGRSAARDAGRAGRSIARGRPAGQRRVRPYDLLAVPGAAQRRLLERAGVRLSPAHRRARRPRAGALRRRAAGPGRTRRRHRADAGVDVGIRSPRGATWR